AARGLIERVSHRRGPRYGKAVLAVGIYERQLPRLDAELERDMRQYAAEAFGAALHQARTPQMRTVPVHASIPLPLGVAPFEDIRVFVKQSPGPFAAMSCICRHGKDLLGEPCRQTNLRETCLTFETAADSMVEAGAARYITREQVLQILDAADREGLVLQPQNTAAPLFLCCCCGCCCHVLQTARQLPQPSRVFSTSYRARVDAARCEACGTCLTRCQMDAIVVEGDLARVTEPRCIGCGLCVTTCPSGAMSLTRLPELRLPPRDTPALYTKIFIERFGRFAAAAALAKHVVGAKV
ncbi:MAG: ATP-binding protein, partial [Acidobacteriota bacterium]